MGITKLMHIKQRANGNPSAGLYACIKYILNEEKTEDNIWIGGNCGTTVNEVFHSMMDTKNAFGKADGRQGYHFVISCAPGEADIEQMYDVLSDFCKEYLGDNYEYVYAVHMDKGHMHGHICFNSVSRISGAKYRYERGDWKKYIQPVTDRVCERYGLKKLEYEEQRIGKSYGEHLAEKEGRMTWIRIIRADIDYAISNSNSFEEFLEQMKLQGYQFRFGTLKKHGEYMTFYHPYAGVGKRTSSLGKGYSLQDIKKRIQFQKVELRKYKYPIVKNMLINGDIARFGKRYGKYQVRKIRRVFQSKNYHYLNPYAIDQARVRRDLLHIHNLAAECRIIINYDIDTEQDARIVYDNLGYSEKSIRNMEGITKGDKDIRGEYQNLKQKLQMVPKGDDSFEKILDRMEQLEEQYPMGLLEAQENNLNKIKEEKRVLRRILKDMQIENNEKLLVTKGKELMSGRKKSGRKSKASDGMANPSR